MLWAYFNYPTERVTIHRDAACPQVRVQGKENQRVIQVTPDRLEPVLNEFVERRHSFALTSAQNDLWLEVALDRPEQEEGVVNTLQALLGVRYAPFKRASVNTHCPAS